MIMVISRCNNVILLLGGVFIVCVICDEYIRMAMAIASPLNYGDIKM